jgi:hypothetical protein
MGFAAASPPQKPPPYPIPPKKFNILYPADNLRVAFLQKKFALKI